MQAGFEPGSSALEADALTGRAMFKPWLNPTSAPVAICCQILCMVGSVLGLPRLAVLVRFDSVPLLSPGSHSFVTSEMIPNKTQLRSCMLMLRLLQYMWHMRQIY